jgi:apolipoprotein N-acyltransferase
MIQNRKLKLTLLTLLPGLLFWLAWPPRDFFFLSFIAFVPLLLLEKETHDTKRSGWLLYASLLFWNIVISWWVGYAEFYSAIFMMVANAWLMYLPWWGYRKARKLFGDGKALLVLLSLWLSYEYLHLTWEITWPWFMLGNIFAKHNNVVQWYEITGALGGSLWVLVLNVLIYKQIGQDKFRWRVPALLLVIPILISFVFKFLSTQVSYFEPQLYETILVQPNIDPYSKFAEGEEVTNLVKMLDMAETEISPETKYVILPETAVVEYVNEDNPDRFRSIEVLRNFTKRHPQAHLITGISTYNWYEPGEVRQATARESNGDYFESYNTAMEIDSAGTIAYYHKSKLVPGAEKMPYPKVFKFLDFLALDLGGITGSLGMDSEPKVFKAGESPDLAPLICYESVFPGFVAGFTRKGAEILLVITNDGWWRDTDGYKQHMYYACLRAIENRREVLRCANTGISCRIDKFGTIQERTNWWEPAVLKVQADNNAKLTFYSKHGDYLGRFASFIGIFFLLGMMVKRLTKRDTLAKQD